MRALPVKKLSLCAVLAAAALGIFVLEAQIPLPVPVPGMKLGLSNVVTVFALFALGRKEAAGILTVRILLGNLVTGQVTALLYALAGGLLSFLTMALLRRWLKQDQIWVAGALGGMAHNIGQMAVALALTQTSALLLYLPVLLLCGILAGAFTGLCAQLLLHRFPKEKF